MSDEFFFITLASCFRAIIFSAAAIWIAYIMRPVLLALVAG